jgi:hypothetical protein
MKQLSPQLFSLAPHDGAVPTQYGDSNDAPHEAAPPEACMNARHHRSDAEVGINTTRRMKRIKNRLDRIQGGV